MDGTASQDDLTKFVHSSGPRVERVKTEPESMMWSTVVLVTNSEHKHQSSKQENIQQGRRKMGSGVNVGKDQENCLCQKYYSHGG